MKSNGCRFPKYLLLVTVLVCAVGVMYVGRVIPKQFCLKDLGTGRIYGPFDLIVDKQIDLAPLRYMTTQEILGRYEIVNPSRKELLFHQQLDKTIFKKFSVRQSSIQDVIDMLSYCTQEHWNDRNESIGMVEYKLDLSNYAYWYKPAPDCLPAKLMTNEPPHQTWAALDVSLWTVINIIAENARLRPLIRGNTIIFTQDGVARSSGSAAYKDWGPIKP